MNTSLKQSSRVVVLGTGGTIAGRASSTTDNVGYVAGQVGISDMLRGIDVPAGVSLEAEQVAQVDSKDMDFSTWQALALRCAHWLAQPDVAGVVVTHGTDTLEETAFFLQSVLAPVKPVVLTCAMRPSTALAPDGPQNVRDAIALAAEPGARGVCMVCAGAVHGALDVRKVHTYRLDAFDSGDAGPLGYMEEGRLRRLRDWPAPSRASADRLFARIARLDPGRWPRVEIVTSHAGARGSLIGALLRERAVCAPGSAEALRGLVIAATGNGTVHHALEAAALEARAASVAVVRATRCAAGRIIAASAGAPDALRDAGALTPVKARIALMLELVDGDPDPAE